MKRILFLDIDGVLNSLNFFLNRPDSDNRPFPLSEIDPNAIHKLNKILNDCKITDLVVTSDWILSRDIKSLLPALGVDKPWCDNFSTIVNINKLNNTKRTVKRGKQIKDFLNGVNESFVFCILDDTDEFSKDQHKNLVLTDFNIGLTNDDVKKVINIFNFR